MATLAAAYFSLALHWWFMWKAKLLCSSFKSMTEPSALFLSPKELKCESILHTQYTGEEEKHEKQRCCCCCFVRDYPTGVQVTFAPFDQLLAFFLFFSIFFALRTIENYRLYLQYPTASAWFPVVNEIENLSLPTTNQIEWGEQSPKRVVCVVDLAVMGYDSVVTLPCTVSPTR